MTDARLADILAARGIRGVLLGPNWGDEPHVELPWDRFSAVLLGAPEAGPHLQRVCNHHAHGSLTALRALAAKGYRDIGVALVRRHERATGYGYAFGAELFRLDPLSKAKVTTWIYDKWNDAEVRAWVRDNRLDAVLSIEFHNMFTNLRTAAGASVGYANLAIWPGIPISGIDQNPLEIGAAGVDMLRSQMLGGSRGIEARPRILLVDGVWVEDRTTPGAGLSYEPVKEAAPSF